MLKMANQQVISAKAQNEYLTKLRKNPTSVDRYEAWDFRLKKSSPKQKVHYSKKLKDEILYLSTKLKALQTKLDWYDRNSQVIPPWQVGHSMKPAINLS